MKGLSRREFAKKVNCSPTLVQRLCKSNVIPQNEDGSIPEEAGIAAWNARGGNQRQADPPSETAGLSLDLRREELSARAHKAKLLELELQRRRGELVPIAEVQAGARALCGEIRERLLTLPPRCALPCEGKTASEIEALLADEVNLILTALHGAEAR